MQTRLAVVASLILWPFVATPVACSFTDGDYATVSPMASDGRSDVVAASPADLNGHNVRRWKERSIGSVPVHRNDRSVRGKGKGRPTKLVGEIRSSGGWWCDLESKHCRKEGTDYSVNIDYWTHLH